MATYGFEFEFPSFIISGLDSQELPKGKPFFELGLLDPESQKFVPYCYFTPENDGSDKFSIIEVISKVFGKNPFETGLNFDGTIIPAISNFLSFLKEGLIEKETLVLNKDIENNYNQLSPKWKIRYVEQKITAELLAAEKKDVNPQVTYGFEPMLCTKFIEFYNYYLKRYHGLFEENLHPFGDQTYFTFMKNITKEEKLKDEKFEIKIIEAFSIIELIKFSLASAFNWFSSSKYIESFGNKAFFTLLQRTSFKSIFTSFIKDLHEIISPEMLIGYFITCFNKNYIDEKYLHSPWFKIMDDENTIGPFDYFRTIEGEEIVKNKLYENTLNKFTLRHIIYSFYETNSGIEFPKEYTIDEFLKEDFSYFIRSEKLSDFVIHINEIGKFFLLSCKEYFRNHPENLKEEYVVEIEEVIKNLFRYDWLSPFPLDGLDSALGLFSRIKKYDTTYPIIELRDFKHFYTAWAGEKENDALPNIDDPQFLKFLIVNFEAAEKNFLF